MRFHRSRAVPIALLAALALSQGPVLAATADNYPENIAFTDTTAVSIEYGEGWSYSLSCDAGFVYSIYNHDAAVVTMTGAPAGYTPTLAMYVTGGPTFEGYGNVYSAYDKPPLGAGSYTINVGGTYTDGSDTWTGQTSPGVTLTVSKAKLGIDLRVLADPANGDAAIVSAAFTGGFVDAYQSSFFPGSAVSPAGTWRITLTDAKGGVALTRSIDRAAGDDVLATSFYWADAVPGEQYTASAEFVGSGSSANNFTFASAPDFSYTAPELQRAVPTSTATTKPDPALPDATGFTLPLWTLIVIGLLIAALATLVTILSVKIRRAPTPSRGEGTA